VSPTASTAAASSIANGLSPKWAPGAQIEFLTADPALIASLHLWEAAQVKDHGKHAK